MKPIVRYSLAVILVCLFSAGGWAQANSSEAGFRWPNSLPTPAPIASRG